VEVDDMTVAASIPLADTWGMHGDVGAGWMIVMMLLMVLFWAALILGVVWIVRGPYDGWRGGRRETPSEILDRRFAAGEISVEEYDERRSAIGHGDLRSSERATWTGPATG
jgi:putative membrane protein